ncbi:MAG TPA: cellulase family glycosylhydrolase [Polyangia bacterium]
MTTSASRRDVLRGAAAFAGTAAIAACHNVPAVSSAAAAAVPKTVLPGGLEVRGTRFYRDGKPFFVSGFNYWSALPNARQGNDAGWDQIRRDLDAMQGLGVNMLRIMGATEGPDSEPLRIVPSLQPSPGQYDPAGVAGLLRLVAELEKRKLHAIFIMNNFWHWSGGMAQYLAWAGQGPIPYPPPHPGGSWDTYQKTTANFYSNEKALKLYDDLLRFVVPQLKSSPSVIWELANEPRGMRNIPAFHRWIDETAGLIRTLAPGQLITTGSEGQTADPRYAGVDVAADHQSPNIDFITFHMWAQNWNWVKRQSLAHDLPRALDLAKKYLNDHVTRVAKVGKPLLLEEFGFPRDEGNFDPAATTTLRDQYFDAVYGMVHSLIPNSAMAGIMPWAWAGDTRPPRPGEFWKPGDPFIGDPPHEEQGWYSVYTPDTTVKLIQDWTAKITGTTVTS